MKLVRWSYEGLCVPMIEDDNGDLWVVARALGLVLGISEDAIRKIRSRHLNEFTSEDVADRNILEFIAGVTPGQRIFKGDSL